jgi:hypothetical protein
MAKRRKSRTSVTVSRRPSFGGFRPAAPIVIRQTTTPKVKHRRRRSGGGGDSSSLTSKENMALAAGALVLGFIDRQKIAIPTIPILGRAGSLAVGGLMVGKHMHLPIATKVGKAALVIALYELGKEGKVSGVDGVDTV